MDQGRPLTKGDAPLGVEVLPLTQVADERGNLMHMIRSDSPASEKFGEIYFSKIKFGAVKAWRRHQSMVCRIAVPMGLVRIVLYDGRTHSSTRGKLQTILTGSDRYALVRIPPEIWYGFKGEAPDESLIANCATLPHDPQEIDRLPPDTKDIPYSWAQASVT